MNIKDKVTWEDETKVSKEIVDELMNGSIDMHVHSAPDASRARRMSCIPLALAAMKSKMKGLVLKNHQYMTAPLAEVVRNALKIIIEQNNPDEVNSDFYLFGGIPLNYEQGGLNPFAVDNAARLGAKIVWMPTISSAYSRKKPEYVKNNRDECPGISIIDEKGQLHSEVIDILDIISSNNMILATGHLSVQEISVLIDAAKTQKVEKILVNHPLIQRTGPNASIDIQKEWIQKGAIMEHCYVITMPLHDQINPSKISHAIKEIGYEHCIMATDFGQAHNPPAPEGMRMFITAMLELGITEKEIRYMITTKPTELLEL